MKRGHAIAILGGLLYSTFASQRRAAIAAAGIESIPTISPYPPAPSPSVLLDRYAAALARVTEPQLVVFNYAVDQVGSTNLSETHHIYRAGPRVRDETLSRDRQRLRSPSIAFATRVNRYAIAAVAPTMQAYAIRHVGEKTIGGRHVFSFRTEARAASRFAVTAFELDAQHYLPLEISFSSAAGASHGMGTLAYAPVRDYWLIREATVASGTGAAQTRERIRWTSYRLPTSLPDQTFRKNS